MGHPWARYRDHQPIGGQSATGASTFNNRYGVAHKPTTAPLVHSQRPSFWQPSRIISPGRTPCPAADHSRATSTEPHGSATTRELPVAAPSPTASGSCAVRRTSRAWAPRDVFRGQAPIPLLTRRSHSTFMSLRTVTEVTLLRLSGICEARHLEFALLSKSLDIRSLQVWRYESTFESHDHRQ